MSAAFCSKQFLTSCDSRHIRGLDRDRLSEQTPVQSGQVTAAA
jgi:hypothetical protein